MAYSTYFTSLFWGPRNVWSLVNLGEGGLVLQFYLHVCPSWGVWRHGRGLQFFVENKPQEPLFILPPYLCLCLFRLSFLFQQRNKRMLLSTQFLLLWIQLTFSLFGISPFSNIRAFVMVWRHSPRRWGRKSTTWSLKKWCFPRHKRCLPFATYFPPS